MRREFCLVLALIIIVQIAPAVEWVALTGPQGEVSVEVVSSQPQRIELTYDIAGYYAGDEEIAGQVYQMLSLPGESRVWQKGAPSLPRVCRSVIIPDNQRMTARIIAAEYIELEDVQIAPSKGHLARSIDPGDVPYEFGEVYRRDGWFPEETVTLRKPYILREVRGQVIELNAFQYHPTRQVLRVYTHVEIELTPTGIDDRNVLLRDRQETAMTPEYRAIYQKHFLNFDATDYDPVDEVGSMLIITYDEFSDALQPLVDWRNQKGVPTTLVNVSDAGSTSGEIKEYIRSVYEASDLVYVLLVGDAGYVATPGDGEDPTYGQMAGNDSYPELFVGRFSASNLAHVETQVERTITYEKYPVEWADWYTQGIGIGSAEGPGHYGEYDWEHIDLIRDDLLAYHYDEVDQMYDPGATSWEVTEALNEGRSIINYCGHGNDTGWGTTGYSNGQINLLTNDNMLPFITNVACLVGNFASTTCFGETWLRATHDGAPTGAIGFWGSSISQSWAPPMYAQDEVIDLLVADDKTTFGALCFNGAMEMIDQTGMIGSTETDHWTIFGDPSLQVRTLAPLALEVEHENYIRMEQTTFPVTVTAQEGALAALSADGILIGHGYTDVSGSINIDVEESIAALDQLTVTVTAPNGMPYTREIPVVPSTGPYVIGTEITVEDGVTGNGNGTLDLGETASLTIEVENVGSEAVAGIEFVLRCADTLATVTDSTAALGELPAGGIYSLEEEFALSISPAVENGHALEVVLAASSGGEVWESRMTLTVHAPIIMLDEFTIEDGAFNGNGCFDPGETADVRLEIDNNGSTVAEDLQFELSCSDPLVTIPNGSISYNAIAAGETVYITFTDVAIDAEMGQGQVIQFELAVSGWGGYEAQADFETTVGDLRFNPIGPDAYGYVAYDLYDGEYAPDFDWTEIAPLAGGAGTVLALTENEATEMDLPFGFRYYGIDYDVVTVGVHGWVWFGPQSIFYPNNLNIPNYVPPNNMIAALWDNLNPERNGQVCQYYDEDTHRFIVEWYQIEHVYPYEGQETFQVVLYDPAYYQTETGDGEIVVHYLEVSEQVGSCTVGIEDQDGERGVQVLHNGNYDAYAMPLENHYSIRYTTSEEMVGVPSEAAAISPAEYSLGQNYPNPFNPTTVVSFKLQVASRVHLTVYDITGRQLAELVDGWRDAGGHELTFDGSGLASGLYFYRIEAGDFQAVRKMVLVK